MRKHPLVVPRLLEIGQPSVSRRNQCPPRYKQSGEGLMFPHIGNVLL
jgi:hypothetical protein